MSISPISDKTASYQVLPHLLEIVEQEGYFLNLNRKGSDGDAINMATIWCYAEIDQGKTCNHETLDHVAFTWKAAIKEAILKERYVTVNLYSNLGTNKWGHTKSELVIGDVFLKDVFRREYLDDQNKLDESKLPRDLLNIYSTVRDETLVISTEEISSEEKAALAGAAVVKERLLKMERNILEGQGQITNSIEGQLDEVRQEIRDMSRAPILNLDFPNRRR